MYNVRMLVAFAGTAFVPYWLNYQLATIPLTLGVVAAGISDIDDRFSVRMMNLIYTYIGFFYHGCVGTVFISLPYRLCHWANYLVYWLDFTRLFGAALCHHCLWLFSGFSLFYAWRAFV